MSYEVELKFDIDAPGVTRAIGEVALLPAPTDSREHETIYYDTPDRTLNRAGYSLRVRRSGDRFVRTIKRKAGGSVGLFVRREWEVDVDGFDLAPEALASTALRRVLDRSGALQLVPLVRTSFRRTRWLVRRGASRIEVALDEGRVVCGRIETPIRELEMELIAGKPSALFSLAQEIGAKLPLRLGVLSKGERGYALADGRLGAPAKAEPLRLSARMDCGAAFRAVALACLRHFRINELALLAGRDGEALHQARVALRRLRTALTLFRPIVEGREYQHLRKELRWFAAQFGAVRDLDVLAERQGPTALPDLLARRAEAHARIRRLLESARAGDLMLRLALWIEGGPWRFRRRAADDIAPFAQQQLDRLWGRVERRGNQLAELAPEARHRLRIGVKKLRYSAEFLAGLSASRAVFRRRDAFVNALRRLQDRLGELNDRELDPASGEATRRTARIGAADPDLQAAQAAFARAAAAARYWQTD